MSKFNVTVHNNSGETYRFLMYQNDEDLINQSFKQVAWMVSPYKTHADATSSFDWEVDYEVSWSNTETLTPGTVIAMSETKPIDIGSDDKNTYQFTVEDNDPHFVTPPTSTSGAGSAYISTQNANPIIPGETFAFGIAMKGKLAFVCWGRNNTLLKMTPKPKYFLVASDQLQEGEIIDAGMMVSPIEFDFPAGKLNAKVTLGPNNVWSEVTYSAT